MNECKINMLIDTDIGDDIDDALALALAIKMHEINLIGVTTVYKNVGLRARIAKKILELSHSNNIPVYSGYGHSISQKNEVNDDICQRTEEIMTSEYESINSMEGDYGKSAVDFIVNQAKNYGKKLTIVAIGPLTNIAKAILQNPQAMSGIGRLVIMGGAFFMQKREWNIICDVKAADIVFSSNCPLECIGLDVTEQLQLTFEQHQHILGIHSNDLVGYIADLVRMWTDYNNIAPILHDPLAIYYSVYSDIVLMEDSNIHVETNGEYTAGMTVNLDNYNSNEFTDVKSNNIRVSHYICANKFKEYFMEKLFNYQSKLRGLD